MGGIQTTMQDSAKKPNDVRTYTVVWLGLIVLTALTVASAQMNMGRLAIFICLAIASFKSILVFLYFMHLRHEERLLVKLIIPIAMVTLAIFIGLTFTDVVVR
jgi:cytochrome c oxidase subunit IV